MLVPYIGRVHAGDDVTRYTGLRHARYSRRSWFVELWLRGRYVGLTR